MRGRDRSLAAAVALAAALLAGVALSGIAEAAPWCGTVAPADRPAVVGGVPIRVIYALPTDGADQAVQRAPQISADVDAITEWWRGQDYARVPRFDVAAFPCGRQADIVTTRVPRSREDLRPTDGRFEKLVDVIEGLGPDSAESKYLVYYDGPVSDESLCGQGGGSGGGPGIAIVYLAACTVIPTQVIAAHELLHAFGALASAGPPNACPDSPAHPCDSSGDILYPYAPTAQLGVLALDVGRNDYYAHAGTWLDVQDSSWLRHIEAPPVVLTVNATGGGSVQSDVPGIDCAASCALEFDGGSVVQLQPSAAPGKRFIRWSGGCTGNEICAPTLGQPTVVNALFAPSTYRLAVSVTGKGRVGSVAAGVSCAGRCIADLESYAAVVLRTTPARGWKLQRWSGGGCAAKRATCRVPMTAATAVRAIFVRK